MALSAYYNGGGAPQSGSYSRVNIAGGNNSLEPAAASYNIVRTKQADAFPVFIQRATYTRDYNSQRQQQPIPPFLQSSTPQLSSPSFASHSQHQHACTPVNNHNNHARQRTDHYHNGKGKSNMNGAILLRDFFWLSLFNTQMSPFFYEISRTSMRINAEMQKRISFGPLLLVFCPQLSFRSTSLDDCILCMLWDLCTLWWDEMRGGVLIYLIVVWSCACAFFRTVCA